MLATGALAHSALRAAETLSARDVGTALVDPRWLLPVSLLDLVGRHHLVVTVKDNTCPGGFGSVLAQLVAVEHPDTPVRCLALPSRFAPHGERHNDSRGGRSRRRRRRPLRRRSAALQHTRPS
ncbi:transketolase C-terminal domain-containing protein [Streptomyces cellulosae]